MSRRRAELRFRVLLAVSLLLGGCSAERSSPPKALSRPIAATADPSPVEPPPAEPPRTVPPTVSGAASSEPPAHEAPLAAPPPPPRPDDGRQLLTAPERYDHVILKISHPPEVQFVNLRYEGHNALVAEGATEGTTVAERWASLVAGTRAVFVLRDSMWSQQDHPYHRRPHALMMPPSWVTMAVALGAKKRPIRPPASHPVEDDAAWTAIPDPEAMFGSFPPSDSLHREASQPLGDDVDQARRTRAARASLASLAADVRAMREAAVHGPSAIAEAGARRIAASDRRYFGAALRFHRVVPIFVENPNTKELKSEGKGMVPPGKIIDPALVRIARDAVYRRRLRDGDLAIERYDLSRPAERARAIALLEALLPAADPPPGGTLWLWVTGPLDPHRKAEGENATKYLPRFRTELEAAPVAHDRVKIVSKPSTTIPSGPGRATAFERDARWYRHRGLPYSVRLTARDLAEIMAAGR